jgi:hypothetical protein
MMRASGLFISSSVRRSTSRSAIAAATCALVVSCATPVVVYRSPAEALAAEYGRALRLETSTGERYTIYQGRVHNDTLYAVRIGMPAGADSTVALPLAAVRSLTRVDPGMSAATTGIIGMTVGLLGGFLIAAALLVAAST